MTVCIISNLKLTSLRLHCVAIKENTDSCLLMQSFCSLFQGERNCLWRDCGFYSVEGPEEMRRHLFFHCYHTKLKQLGQQVLNTRPKIGTCSIGYQNRNIIPEIPDNFICLWEECEVSLVLLLMKERFLTVYLVFKPPTPTQSSI